MLLTSSQRGSTSNVLACKGVLILLFLLIGAIVGRPVDAQDFFPTDATINYALPDGAVVGYANENDWLNRQNPTSPTVVVVAGASIGYMYAYNSSHVNISGGSPGWVDAVNSSQINISGGSTGLIYAANSSHVNISGGSIGGVDAYDNSTVNYSGASSGPIVAANSSTVNISGGSINEVVSWNNSTVNISGGFTYDYYVNDNSTLNFYGKNLKLNFLSSSTGSVFYYLSGTLRDGTDVTGLYVFMGTNAKTNLKVAPPPLIDLTKATTLDAQSVTVDYMISKADVVTSLQFNFYRSAQPAIDFSSSSWVGIDYITISPNDVDNNDKPALNIGKHTVTFTPSTGLPPFVQTSTGTFVRFPYVVVLASDFFPEDPASVNTTYFRKFLLGVVVHGFTFASDEAATLDWMTSMKSDLILDCSFDDVITFNWMKESRKLAAGQATGAGDRLYKQLSPEANTLAKHPGDVVDIHFIGHSRGTVVVSQALQDFVGRKNPALMGSYVEVTLLDIHPANTSENGLLSHTGVRGAADAAAVSLFDLAADDPEITVPAGADIMSVDIWYQQTPSTYFPTVAGEHTINLWGESKKVNGIINHTLIPIAWHDLTRKTAVGVGILGQTNGLIGHTEVHEYYQLYEIDKGLVN